MELLVIANIGTILVAIWAVWECRLSLRSRWDSPRTLALVFFALGVSLDSPWRVFSEVSLAGRYYVLALIGHICYLIAGVLGNKFIYLRLLPDKAIDAFMRRALIPMVCLATAVMVVAFAASPATVTVTVDQLYLVPADGWLKAYWLTYYGALTALFVVGIYGVHRLRTDPRSVMLGLLWRH